MIYLPCEAASQYTEQARRDIAEEIADEDRRARKRLTDKRRDKVIARYELEQKTMRHFYEECLWAAIDEYEARLRKALETERL